MSVEAAWRQKLEGEIPVMARLCNGRIYFLWYDGLINYNISCVNFSSSRYFSDRAGVGDITDMIRFCDREVYWIEYCKLAYESEESRTDLLKYFLDGHQDDVICVRDNRIFMGIITYQSLNRFLTAHEAIRKEYLVWNKDIWKNAREYCKRHPRSGTEYLIPVLDENNQLYCFAYEDLDANREVRMLRELTEIPEVLQFTDIYPNYKCVIIHEFNELAYFFAKYLEERGGFQ